METLTWNVLRYFDWKKSWGKFFSCNFVMPQKCLRVLFLYLLKTSKNQMFPDASMVYRKRLLRLLDRGFIIFTKQFPKSFPGNKSFPKNLKQLEDQNIELQSFPEILKHQIWFKKEESISHIFLKENVFYAEFYETRVHLHSQGYTYYVHFCISKIQLQWKKYWQKLHVLSLRR